MIIQGVVAYFSLVKKQQTFGCGSWHQDTLADLPTWKVFRYMGHPLLAIEGFQLSTKKGSLVLTHHNLRLTPSLANRALCGSTHGRTARKRGLAWFFRQERGADRHGRSFQCILKRGCTVLDYLLYSAFGRYSTHS